MRPDTIVFAKFESKGRPKETRTESGRVIDIAKWIAVCMLESTMGHKIQITIGRSLADIENKDSSSESLAEFDDFLNELGIDDSDFGDS